MQGCVQACKLRAVCDQGEALSVAGGTSMTLDEIVSAVLAFDAGRAYPYGWVSISGGEPTEQNIEPIAWKLQGLGKRVRLETSGLARRVEGPWDYIRVSPKEPRPLRTKQDWGLELSVVYTGAEDLRAWEEFGAFAMRTLQPLWRPDGSSNLAECVQICHARPIWQLSVQTHKLLGLK
jgi:organic radical activating enzyme